MKLSKTEFLALVRKYLLGNASSGEKAFLEAYYQYFEQDEDGLSHLSNEEKELLETAMRERIIADIHRQTPVRAIYKWGWAAAILLLIAAGTYFWPKQKPSVNTPLATAHDAAPGKTGAILTLSDGSQVTLDSLGNGIVASQNGAQAVLMNGQLSYQPSSTNADVIAFNTMSTPRGRQFHLQLPDGTDVWLNAASSIRYPTRFAGKERTVQVTGEVYFEVAQHAAMPFHVQVNNQAEVEVLGTHFNVNAYTNENSLRTTLLEGAVRVRRGTATATLRPREQAAVSGTGDIAVQQVDTDIVMAWKAGVFNFDKASLPTVMREIERWYDIEVVYEKNVPDIKFGGEMSRNIPLSGVLRVLKDAGVHCRQEAGRLIVMP